MSAFTHAELVTHPEALAFQDHLNKLLARLREEKCELMTIKFSTANTEVFEGYNQKHPDTRFSALVLYKSKERGSTKKLPKRCFNCDKDISEQTATLVTERGFELCVACAKEGK